MSQKKITTADIARQYQTRDSFPDLLPWAEFSDDENIMMLEDMKSYGMALEIQDISSEAKPDEVIQQIHKSLKGMMDGALPLEDKNPWVIQLYIQDDLTLDPLFRRLEDYVKDKNDPLTKNYLGIMERHFKLMCREGGMFVDPLSNLPFRAKTRRIRAVVYRRYEEETKDRKNVNRVNELKAVIQTLISKIQQGGMNVRKLKGKHFYEWMVRWFNPRPALTNGSQDELLKRFPYPEKKPFGWNFNQNVLFDTIKDDQDSWLFDGIKHKVMVFKDLQSEIDIGVISRERTFGDGTQCYALIDKFPPGTIYTIQIVFESRNAVEKHLAAIKKAAVGPELSVQEIKQNVERALYEINNGNMLYRSTEALFIRADNNEQLEERERTLRTLLSSSGLSTIATEEELYPLDAYMRYLPFNFSYRFDKKHGFRSTYKYADDIARLQPLYGRANGDKMNPMLIHFNRGGEYFIYDFNSRSFKSANSHVFITGPTGSGKSVALNNLIIALSAHSNPRIIAVETGGSFDYVTQYLKKYGRNVRSIKFSRDKPIFMNPYADAYRALEIVEAEEAQVKKNEERFAEEGYLGRRIREVEDEMSDLKEAKIDSEGKGKRDILTEMTLATRIMLTGADDRENATITRSDMMLIMDALILTMKRCRDAGAPQVLVQDVQASFNLMAEECTNTIDEARLRVFGRNLQNYVRGMKAQFVNGMSEPLGEFDYLHVDFGFLQEDSEIDLLNMCCISLLSKIMSIAEAGRASITGRDTFLIFDEIHIFLNSEIGVVYLTLLAKVARKFGVWLIFATQNLGDFPGTAKKILSMLETWVVLSSDVQELAQIESFRPLTREMRELLLSVKKFPGVYSEGVLLGARHKGLFRSIPPRFMLALSMTERDERVEIAKIMEEFKFTDELDAIEVMAKRLEERERQEISDDHKFMD